MSKVPWYEQPEARPPDMRDSLEHVAVQEALAELPADHPARRAYSEGLDTIALTHLVRDRRNIAQALSEAYLAGWRRSLARGSGFRP